MIILVVAKQRFSLAIMGLVVRRHEDCSAGREINQERVLVSAGWLVKRIVIDTVLLYQSKVNIQLNITDLNPH